MHYPFTIVFRPTIIKSATVSSPLAIHVLSLDTIGGVESLYVHFLSTALAHPSSIHYTSVSGRHPHKQFAKIFDKLRHKPFLEQYIMGLRIPRFLRGLVTLRREMVQGIVQPTSWVYWNRIEDQLPPGPAVYYEHGAAWNVPVTKKRQEFIKSCSRIIANSEAATIMLREKWDIEGEITVIPNPLRPDIRLRKESKTLSPHQKVRLGFCGRLLPIKGVFVALHALRALLSNTIEATLDIAGVGRDEQLIRQRAKELGISKNVRLLGTVQDIESFYDNIDLLLVPSLREPLGLVALEAASRGVPVICCAVDGLPEAVVHGETGLCIPATVPLDADTDLVSSKELLPEMVVNPITKLLQAPTVCDPLDFAKAIISMIENPNTYASMSIAALAHAEKRADFTKYFQNIIAVLEGEAAKATYPSDQDEATT
jgi:glycosyltransferase involved in cell wall biosynthesis